ncbi:MAG TPA: acyltransferase [Tepidisphaeraceae bacterium]|nr:acyltransferase [Tepidisphaeraceae bacterium]
MGQATQFRAATAPLAPPEPVQAATAVPAAVAVVKEPRPQWLDRGRIPCLDGLRAFSIALVFLEHISLIVTRGHHVRHGPREGVAWYFGNVGGVGVDVFFAISGFLITLLLVRELNRADTISLKGFYTRRFLRLMPAAIVFIGTIFALQLAGRLHLTGRNWAHVLTYTANFDPQPAWQTGHLWSLSIEEQFYFVWPIALLLLGPRRAGIAAFAWLIGAPLFRFALLRLHPHDMGRFDFWTPVRVDCIAAGCLLAVAAGDDRFRRMTRTSPRLAAALVGAAAFTMFASYVAGYLVPLYGVTVGHSVRAACVVAIIWLSINHAASTWGRLLEWRLLVGIGILSYSLYLWQQLFLGRDSGSSPATILLNVGLAVAAALGSYFLVERPFLRIKERAGKRAA